jgi:hypothetical protein
MKICNCCKKTKKIDEFPKALVFKDGRGYTCNVCQNERTKSYYMRNKEKCYVATKKWAENNIERKREIRRKSEKKKRLTPEGRLHSSIHNGIWAQLRTGKKGRKSFSLIGYTLEELKNHLENQFKEGMSWENYGEWNIDHIIPISAFDITSAEDIDFKRCWDLSNLQPLWARDNFSKRASLPMTNN